MATMDIEDVRRILVACAGEDDAADLSGDILDVTFQDLGYDSLAMMETAARITQEYGVDLSDDEITEVATPRALLDLVNRSVAATA
ncbi:MULTISPECIES: acyl carrier protein [unclassified Streptomyces]|uniref:acyl carrier protein n=1 Tax=unclassified Streptomyces TaxID=2593676 RepID=UPI00085174AE|nr:acyl carrier protein [Streptomyces sp. LUP30]